MPVARPAVRDGLRLQHLTEEDEEAVLPASREIQRKALEAERDTLHRLHEKGEIDQETARRLGQELDLEEQRWSRLQESRLS